MDRLAGKATIITGGAMGMGEASALLFAEEGASVTILDIKDKEGEEVVARIKAQGGEATFVHCDMAKSQDIQNALKKHEAKYGKLDAIFNNAGWDGESTDCVGTDEAVLDKLININLKGVFLVCKYGIPLMIKSGGGSIINSTAASAHDGYAYGWLAPYMTTKGGVLTLTRSLAVCYAKNNIRANSLSPGIINTPMFKQGESKQPDPEAFKKSIEGLMLAGRPGHAKEIAWTAVFLASDESSYVTGIDLLCDGGLILKNKMDPCGPEIGLPSFTCKWGDTWKMD